jgi:hypothetical protein
MPYVKVPEVDREIWVDLHEPIESGLPWFAEVGTEVKLTPEQFAAEMASPDGFIQTADVLSVSQPLRYGAVRMARSAMSYERARRKLNIATYVMPH